MSYQRLLFLATVCAVGAFLTLVLRIAHPHHRQLALVVYGIGWVPFVLSIFKLSAAYHGQTLGILRWKTHILVGIAFLIFAWTFKVLIPVERSPLLEVDVDQLPASLEADRQRLALIDMRMQEATTKLLANPQIHATQMSTEESAKLRADWARFVEASFELDLLKMRYRAFYQVNGFAHPKLHAKAFAIGYGALVSQYRAASVVAAEIGKHETAKKLLDDVQPELGIDEGSFARVQLMVSHPDEILRLNAGRAYLVLMKSRLDDDDATVRRAEDQLAEITHMALTDVGVFVNNPLDVLEHQATNAWYPLQKGIALGMASVRTVSRDYFISPAELKAEEGSLIPGDIMLTRREWHLTNLGIPGYWTHAALHIGSIEQMDRYFVDLPNLKGHAPSAVIRDRFPQVYAALSRRDDSGALPSVIEAMRPGVIVQSLYDSVAADSLAVLRPDVTKSDRWQVVVAALSHFGKPYNYEFDFRTDSALVCSQLVYKAYEPITGLHLEPQMSSGRLLLSPNEIAIKYDREMDTDNAQLELVLFLDGTGVGEVDQRGAEAFRASWSRPKWHIVFQR
jgi:hypothetical protein